MQTVQLSTFFLMALSMLSAVVAQGGGGGYMAFVLSPAVAYGVLSPTALIGITGYLANGRVDLILSGGFGNTILSPQFINNQAAWVVGAGTCNNNGAACRRQLGLQVVDFIQDELEGQGMVNTFMMKGRYTQAGSSDAVLNNPSKARFGGMSKAFLSEETYARLQQYELLKGDSIKSSKQATIALIEGDNENTECNICGVDGNVEGACNVRAQCDISDNLPNPDGGLELPRVSILAFDLDAACMDGEGCLDEKAIKISLYDTFGSTARVSVVERSQYEFEELFDVEDRRNLMNEEKRRLQNLNIDLDGGEQCTMKSSYIVSAVFMDTEEFKTARKEMGSESIEDDIATFLSTDYANLCGIKLVPKFAYNIPSPNDPEFNRAVRPLEQSLTIPTIQLASEENGHENIAERGESYNVVMDDFKSSEDVVINLVRVDEDAGSEEVRMLRTVPNYNSMEGPVEFMWTIGDLQPLGTYYFEATIRDVPVSYSSPFEIIAA